MLGSSTRSTWAASERVARASGLAIAFAVLLAAGCMSGDDSLGTGDGGCAGQGTFCAGSCVDLQTDNAHCGGCATACTAGEVCSQGKCATSCGGGTQLCGTICAETSVDPNNCGTCGNKCPIGAVCSNGKCGTSCVTGQTLCAENTGSPYCANTKTDNANCGQCGHPCVGPQVCVGGACTNSCPSADGGVETLCTPDGGAPYCTNTTTDNSNCGKCGNVCGAGQTCKKGSCTNACAAPDGGAEMFCTPDAGLPYCAKIDSDNVNCGGCGNVCPPTLKCQGGGCVPVTIFPQSSYAASVTFTDFYDGYSDTDMGVAFDGTNFWVDHGGFSNVPDEGEYDSNYKLMTTLNPGLDFRSLYTIGSTLYARVYSSPVIHKQTSPGVFTSALTLTGQMPDPQTSIVLDTSRNELVEMAQGTLHRWDATSGGYVAAVTLSGYGQPNENAYPQNRGVVVTSGIYLTYFAGVLSAWVNGTRVATTTLIGAGTTFNSYFGFSYSNGLVWIVDNLGGTWRGYDVGL